MYTINVRDIYTYFNKYAEIKGHEMSALGNRQWNEVRAKFWFRERLRKSKVMIFKCISKSFLKGKSK